eukprot:312849_1
MTIVFHLVYLISIVTSQPSTICLWDATGDDWDRYNGEYTKEATLFNGYAWYKQTDGNPNCGVWRGRLFNSIWSNSYYWQFHTSTFTDWQPLYPDCETTNIADPSLCAANDWWVYSDGDTVLEGPFAWSVTSDVCPTLPCGRIQVTGSGNSNCNMIFEKDPSYDYVYTYAGSRYLYFNPWTFKWYCSNTLGNLDCGNDDTISHQMWSSSSDGWNEVLIGNQFDLPVTTGQTATLKCLETLVPTAPTAPTVPTTASPTMALLPATVLAHCDGTNTVSYSTNAGSTYTYLGTETNWKIAFQKTFSGVTRDYRLKFSCAGGTGTKKSAFIANVAYDGVNYATYNPITDWAWEFNYASDGDYTLQYKDSNKRPWENKWTNLGIPSTAKWVT